MEQKLVKRRFQKLYDDDAADMTRRRKMKLDELGLAIILRGKAHRFGNPFYQSDTYICKEWGMPRKMLRRLRKLLQIKGVIKFNTGDGRGYATEYVMLDTVMVPEAVDNRSFFANKGSPKGNKGSPKGILNLSTKGFPNGNPNNNDTIQKNEKKSFLGIDYEKQMKPLTDQILSRLSVGK